MGDFLANEDPREYGVPHDKWRSSQKQAFEWAVNQYNEGEKYLFCELPTGSGKSSIAAGLGSISPVLMHVQTLNLLDQYQDEYGFSVVKGRANYQCVHPKKISKWSNQGKGIPMVDSCSIEPMNECPYYNVCPYIVAREKAMTAKRSGCTYKFGIVSPKVRTRGGISVLDEAHASANECLEYASVIIPDK